MDYETEAIRPRQVSTRSLDAFDRKILGVLVKDARLPYAEIGNLVGLSPPAVHDRVKKLREAGIIRGVHASVDGPAVGKPLLAYVHVDAEGWGKSQRMMRLQAFPEVEEMHSVAGDTCVVLKVRTADTHALEHLLLQIYILPGVKGTKSYIVLSTYLERPVQAEVTGTWPSVPMPDD
ncbi:Lrp/AsnC family transcriptional regulator [Devosia sediminis]|uniref:Lrp/AsnC family transcriptional regulator n=1 Tax=Devosia sediminis TaxID=2798801 RepID=A0A934IXT2_9HYPH|nr:Lrp/AsnC family transcriptional regulator [Devosia sediminis]MBJ3783899.1 Lrp/AsnC family transcriptional regulator [Devosia sediminis]